MVLVINCIYFIFNFKALAEEASEDELPSDVDLNDPYFAEEVKKMGKPTHICSFQVESKEKKMTWVETIKATHSFKIPRIFIPPLVPY